MSKLNQTQITESALAKTSSPEIESFLKTVSDKETRDNFRNYFFKQKWFEEARIRNTPLDMIKERDGWTDYETKQVVRVEYFPEEYTLAELDRIYPGWWMEKMKDTPYPEMGYAQVTGYMCIQFPTLKGIEVSKRWAIGGEEYKFKKGTHIPLNPAYTMKGARTDWIKVAGKLYGIGLDVYHQRITTPLRSIFEDRLRAFAPYGDSLKEIAKTLTKGQTFRRFLRGLPTVEQAQELRQLLDNSGLPPEAHVALWGKFLKMGNLTPESSLQIEDWLQKLRDKLTVKKGEQNE